MVAKGRVRDCQLFVFAPRPVCFLLPNIAPWRHRLLRPNELEVSDSSTPRSYFVCSSVEP